MNETSREKYLKDIDYFSKKLEEDPASRLFMPLAFALLKLGRYDETIEVCKKGLDHYPDYHAAKVILANAYLEKGMLEEAENLLYDVIEQVPDNYRANRMLGDILRNNGDLIGASIYYRSALVNAPEDLELRALFDELSETTGITPFDIPSEMKNLEESLAQADKVPLDSDISALKDELHEEGKSIIVEDEIVNNTASASLVGGPARIIVEIPEEEVTSKGQAKDLLEEEILEMTSDTSLDFLLNSSEGASLDVEKELDLLSLDNFSGVNLTEPGSEVSDTASVQFEAALDESIASEADGSKPAEKEDTSVVVEQLESWLNNIKKLKEMRNV
jgi:tetratricopeptide (TPR) repeat protein